MSLMRPMTSLREDLNRIFSDLEQELMMPLGGRRRFEPGLEQQQQLSTWVPPVDIIEEEGSIKVKALVPGLKAEDIDIEIDNNMLCLCGESVKEEAEEKGNFYRKEISSARVFRRIPLPTEVQSDKAKANFENGMLTITIPKSEETRRHKIKVSGGR